MEKVSIEEFNENVDNFFKQLTYEHIKSIVAMGKKKYFEYVINDTLSIKFYPEKQWKTKRIKRKFWFDKLQKHSPYYNWEIGDKNAIFSEQKTEEYKAKLHSLITNQNRIEVINELKNILNSKK